MLLNPTKRGTEVNQIAGPDRQMRLWAYPKFRIDPATGVLGPVNDTTLRPHPQGGWFVTENNFHARFQPWADDNHLSVYSHDPDQDDAANRADEPVKCSLSPVQIAWANEEGNRDVVATIQHVSGDVGGTKVNYQGAFGPGIDLTFNVCDDKLEKWITIDDFSRIGEPSQAVRNGTRVRLQLVFRMQTTAARVHMDDEPGEWDGNTERKEIRRAWFRDLAKNVERFGFDEPMAVDSYVETADGPPRPEPREKPCRYRFHRQGQSLFVMVEVPGAWLRNDAVFPVKIDPVETWGTRTGTDDYDNNIINRSMRIRDLVTSSNCYHYSGSGNQYRYNCIYRVNLADLNASAVASASFSVYVYNADADQSFDPLLGKVLNKGFIAAECNWTYKSSGVAWGSPGGCENASESTNFSDYFLTASTGLYITKSLPAADILAEAGGTYEWLVKRWDTSGDYNQAYGFAYGTTSQRPYVTIDYTAAGYTAYGAPLSMLL